MPSMRSNSAGGNLSLYAPQPAVYQSKAETRQLPNTPFNERVKLLASVGEHGSSGGPVEPGSRPEAVRK